MALYENTIRLKGFVGKNAQSQATTNGKSVIVLSLATKSSYKDKKTNAWISRTEWHRIVCFAKPAEYAKGLKKGDYIEVEGELRSSEFDAEVGNGKQKSTIKRRNWEVRASLVKKLARPQHSDTDTESFSGRRRNHEHLQKYRLFARFSRRRRRSSHLGLYPV